MGLVDKQAKFSHMVGLLLAIDPILDMGRTATNVLGNAIAT